MISISTGNASLIKRGFKPYRYTVQYKLRYWDYVTATYLWQSAWTTIKAADVRSVAPLRMEIDKSSLGTFRDANQILTLRNPANKWDPDNPSSLFKPDNTAKYGYQIYLTQLLIQLIYVNEAGTEQTAITVFNGYVADWQFNVEENTVQFLLQSRRLICQGTNAEGIATTVTAEALGTGDGSTTVFTTVNKGVGFVTQVTDAGTGKVLGTDYTVSQTNDPNNPAKITFTSAPSNGHALTVNYSYWPVAQKIETLVGTLLTQAGIGSTSADRQVDTVIFPNGVLGAKTWQTQSDWQGWILTNMEATSGAWLKQEWFRIDDFADGDYTSNPQWSVTQGNGTASIVGGNLRIYDASGSGETIGVTPNSAGAGTYAPYGTWQFFANFTTNQSGGGTASYSRIRFCVASGFWLNYIPEYLLEWDSPSGSITLYLKKKNTDGTYTTLANCGSINNQTFRITRTAAGLITVYYLSGGSWVSIGSATDTLITSAQNFYVESHSSQATLTAQIDIGSIYFTNAVDTTSTATSVAQATATSPSIDCTSSVTAYGLLTYSTPTIPPGCSLSISTQASADNASWDAAVAIGANGQINSTVRRYLRVVVTYTTPSYNGTNANFYTPEMDKITVNYTTSAITIALANMTGYNVDQAIQQLALLCSYEYFCDRSGKFYFRKRNYADTGPVYTVLKREFKGFPFILSGLDRLKSRIRIAFGSYTVDMSPTVVNDSKPTKVDTYGDSLLSVSNTQILISSDYNPAYGAAVLYYSVFGTKRKRHKFDTHLIPHLELGDIVQLQYSDAVPATPWQIGDTAKFLGNTALQLFGQRQQSAYQRDVRLLSIALDLENEKCVFEGEEVG